jgi:hypothetical protein
MGIIDHRCSGTRTALVGYHSADLPQLWRPSMAIEFAGGVEMPDGNEPQIDLRDSMSIKSYYCSEPAQGNSRRETTGRRRRRRSMFGIRQLPQLQAGSANGVLRAPEQPPVE